MDQALKGLVTTCVANVQAHLVTQPKAKGKKKKQAPKRKTKHAKSTAASRKTITTAVPKAAQAAMPLQQGLRKIQKACDAFGCKHTGVGELINFDRAHLGCYVKEGGWLHKTPCIDCAQLDENESTQRYHILEMAQLLKTGNKELGYYCNAGPRAHTMKEDDEMKPFFACNMALCSPCHAKRNALKELSLEGRRPRRGQAN